MSNFRTYNPDHDTNSGGTDLDPPPDGTYTGCKLSDAAAFTAKSGKDFVKLEWETQTGLSWVVLQGFKSEQQTAVTWSEVAKLGINPVDITSLEQLNTVLGQHVGSYYDLAVKTNGQFRNTYINSPTVGDNPVVQAHTNVGNGGAPPVAAGTVDDDTIPF